MAVGKLMYCMASLSLGLKMKNKKTREWKRNMERKWRDKEDGMDQGRYFYSHKIGYL